MATVPLGQRIYYDPREVQNADLMDIDIATVTQSSWRPAPFVHQTSAANTLNQPTNTETPTMANKMTSTMFGKKSGPIPNILLHPEPTHRDHTPSSGSLERSPLTTVTTNKISSESPRMLRRTNTRLPPSGFVKPTAGGLVPPDPLIPLSPPPVPMTYPFDFPNTLATPRDSPTGHQSPSGLADISPTITYSPPTPPLTRKSQGVQSPSPLSSPVLPRIGTHKRPYYSTVRASLNSRLTSDVSPLSSPPTSPSSITFPTCSSVHQSRSSASSVGRSETSLAAEQPARTSAYGCAASYSNDNTKKSPIVTVPPLPSLPPPSPTFNSFQTRARAPSPMRGVLPVLDLSQDEDENENVDYYGQTGRNKSRFIKYLGTKKSGNSKEKFKNPLSLSLSLERRRGRSFGFGSGKGKEVVPPSPTLFATRSFTGLGSTQGCSMSGEMELKMTLAERDMNSGNENHNNSRPFRFRENQSPSHDGRERNNGRGGGRKLVKARSSTGLTSNLTSGSSPTSGPSKPKIGLRLRKMMSISCLGNFEGNDVNSP